MSVAMLTVLLVAPSCSTVTKPSSRMAWSQPPPWRQQYREQQPQQSQSSNHGWSRPWQGSVASSRSSVPWVQSEPMPYHSCEEVLSWSSRRPEFWTAGNCRSREHWFGDPGVLGDSWSKPPQGWLLQASERRRQWHWHDDAPRPSRPWGRGPHGTSDVSTRLHDQENAGRTSPRQRTPPMQQQPETAHQSNCKQSMRRHGGGYSDDSKTSTPATECSSTKLASGTIRWIMTPKH